MWNENRTRDSLTEQEQDKLKVLIIGYGKLKEVANKLQLNKMSVYRIAATGKGYKKNIIKVRKKLLQPLEKEESN